ncbi:hypothetical protein [Nocardia sp. NPDC052316]|uniref:hypothetical protein n=1 Tax=Nocardia sp. NPDC052316 TaxID=3364329 RepID=UPI0037CA3749
MKLPTPEEFARDQAILDQFRAARAAAAPPPEGATPAGFGGRFSDDLEGTEWEGWTVVNGRWFDQHGNPVD